MNTNRSAEFDNMLKMEQLDKTLTALTIYGSDVDTRWRNKIAKTANRVKMSALMDTWNLETMQAWGAYRKAAV